MCMKLISIIESYLIQEFSNKLVQNLKDKFRIEEDDLEDREIDYYLNRFNEIKDSPQVNQKDVTKYGWKELKSLVDGFKLNRIKAGKLDPEDVTNSEIVYNQNNIRIYRGGSKRSCIKYGDGYNFCISARGDNNPYLNYTVGDKGTPYFVFNYNKSFDKNSDGTFVDPNHLLVIFHFPSSGYDRGLYTVTDANNDGDKDYPNFMSISDEHPELFGLGKIFKVIDKSDTLEAIEYFIKEKYVKRLKELVYKTFYEFFDVNYMYRQFLEPYLDRDYETIKLIIENKVDSYVIIATVKPDMEDDEQIMGTQKYITIPRGDESRFKNEYKGFVDYVGKYIGNVDNYKITVKKADITEAEYQKYVKICYKIFTEYRSDISRVQNKNGGKPPVNESTSN